MLYKGQVFADLPFFHKEIILLYREYINVMIPSRSSPEKPMAWK